MDRSKWLPYLKSVAGALPPPVRHIREFLIRILAGVRVGRWAV